MPRHSRFSPNPTPCGRSRREFLWQVGGGFAGLALVDLLSRDRFFSESGECERGRRRNSRISRRRPSMSCFCS